MDNNLPPITPPPVPEVPPIPPVIPPTPPVTPPMPPTPEPTPTVLPETGEITKPASPVKRGLKKNGKKILVGMFMFMILGGGAWYGYQQMQSKQQVESQAGPNAIWHPKEGPSGPNDALIRQRERRGGCSGAKCIPDKIAQGLANEMKTKSIRDALTAVFGVNNIDKLSPDLQHAYRTIADDLSTLTDAQKKENATVQKKVMEALKKSDFTLLNDAYGATFANNYVGAIDNCIAGGGEMRGAICWHGGIADCSGLIGGGSSTSDYLQICKCGKAAVQAVKGIDCGGACNDAGIDCGDTCDNDGNPSPSPSTSFSCADLSSDVAAPITGQKVTLTCKANYSSATIPVAFFRYKVDSGEYVTSSAITVTGGAITTTRCGAGQTPVECPAGQVCRSVPWGGCAHEQACAHAPTCYELQSATYEITVNKVGAWSAQCRICTNSAATTCTAWGQAN